MPPAELRRQFHSDLEQIDLRVKQLFALVGESLAAATDAFLAGDREKARTLVDQDRLIDEVYAEVEKLIEVQFALQTPMARDLRYLLSVLRIVPELERSGDLAEHIAKRAARGLSGELTPRVRGLIEQMGRVGVEMWKSAADAFAEQDPDVGDRLQEEDDELDELLVSLTAELVSGKLSVPVALEMALVGRFFERLGDHAVNVASRVKYLAGIQER